MRARQHLGRPGTKVIPDRWQGTHGKVIAKTWTVCVEIRHPGAVKSGALDQTTGTYPMVAPDPHFTGKARVQVLATRDQARDVADQAVTEIRYLVAVDLSATEVAVDDVVKFTAAAADNDQTLVDHEMVVRSVARGSLAWERDLICSDNLG